MRSGGSQVAAGIEKMAFSLYIIKYILPGERVSQEEEFR